MSELASIQYWIQRMKRPDAAGAGSSGRCADYKAAFLDVFVHQFEVCSICDLGCADMMPPKILARIDCEYLGIDISEDVIRRVEGRCIGKRARFLWVDEIRRDTVPRDCCELALSMDVIYHILEEPAYEEYLHTLCHAARKWIVIYARDRDIKERPHVRFRRFTNFFHVHYPDWRLYHIEPSPGMRESSAQFYVYRYEGESHDEDPTPVTHP